MPSPSAASTGCCSPAPCAPQSLARSAHRGRRQAWRLLGIPEVKRIRAAKQERSERRRGQHADLDSPSTFHVKHQVPLTLRLSGSIARASPTAISSPSGQASPDRARHPERVGDEDRPMSTGPLRRRSTAACSKAGPFGSVPRETSQPGWVSTWPTAPGLAHNNGPPGPPTHPTAAAVTGAQRALPNSGRQSLLGPGRLPAPRSPNRHSVRPSRSASSRLILPYGRRT
jgi:hypothetical protein